MTMTIHEKFLMAELIELVRTSAKVPPTIGITATSRLVEDLAIDSLDLIQLVLQVQDRFGIFIDEDAVAELCQVGDLATYLCEHGESNES